MEQQQEQQQQPIQISAGQLQSELESIRSLRRISLSQSSNELDPDLPSSLQIDSNTMNNPTTTTTSSTQQEQHQQQPSTSSSNTNHNPVESDEPNPNLFWLPARLHPEIAPQEFKAFIEEATKPENLLRRTSSALGSRRNSGDHLQPSGLSRKKSMLSQIYDPTNDPLPSSSQHHHRPEKAITRGYSMSSPRNLGRGAQGLESLTINDLQLLESLVLKKSSSPSNDPSLDSQFHHLNLNDDRIRAVISRSMTIGGSTSSPSDPEFNSEQLDPEAIDDSPLISRAPGHIIRRTARTKVRKTSLAGDGNGHRFPATRRSQAKSPMVNSHHPRTASTTSNDSEETVSNDLHSNRSSKEFANKSISHSSGPSDDLTLTIDPHPLTLVPTTGPKPSTPLDLPSEDDQSVESNSRPDSLTSNNSFFDAYVYEGATSDDHPAPGVDSSGIDFSNLAASPSTLDFTVPHPIKYGVQATDHSQPIMPIQTSNSSSDPQFVSPPGSSKPDSLKVLTDLAAPAPYRTTRSSDDLPSTSASPSPAISSSTTTTLSTAKSTPSSSTLSSGSPSTPVGPQPSRPPLTTTQTSPNLSSPAPSAIPVPVAPSSASSKEGKEKKRAWVKLGLSSAVSTSSKSKKGKGKDKQKASEAEGATPGPPNSVSAASSGGSNSNGTTTGGGAVKKESGFLSGLFGGKSRKNDSEQSDKQSSSTGGATAPAGSSTKTPIPGPVGLGPASGDSQAQQQLINPTASGGYIKGRFMSFYRLPIHVERAVYRLSHIKLANPRRPLYEQVLISNLMFWYLGVINKSQPAPLVNPNHLPQPAPNSSPSPSSSSPPSSMANPSPSQSSTNSKNKKQGNGRKAKANINNNNPHTPNLNQQNQRNPGAKSWGNQKKVENERKNGRRDGVILAGSGGRNKVRPGRTDGRSSESGSEHEERPSKTHPPPPHQNRFSSSSSSSSDEDDDEDHLSSSDELVDARPVNHHVDADADADDDDDDDEKPLGNRIRALNNLPRLVNNSNPPSSSPSPPANLVLQNPSNTTTTSNIGIHK
ncbi:hypothetical protein PGTUg99_025537 [Puccinia graminis f. sp. tritici]|uniref:Protein Zds1 C-terminal domain-containing protein n=1 Tax=Puccinia graminis f. sp. tritici TaxID=56615 RepID=A0A5B0S625_PUCGR|nr:hypothetical protein PGTUg99_025537 [Puccinia graminis f. sp. tritici]